jgi:hypothetical protein
MIAYVKMHNGREVGLAGSQLGFEPSLLLSTLPGVIDNASGKGANDAFFRFAAAQESAGVLIKQNSTLTIGLVVGGVVLAGALLYLARK